MKLQREKMKVKFTGRLRLPGKCEEMFIIQKRKRKKKVASAKIYSEDKKKKKEYQSANQENNRRVEINKQKEKVRENENIERIKPKNKV